MPQGHHLDIRPYKRNRSVVIVRGTEAVYEIIEEGFFCERFSVEASRLKKTLSVVIKKEFPRSRKIRVYSMGPYPADGSGNPGRKRI